MSGKQTVTEAVTTEPAETGAAASDAALAELNVITDAVSANDTERVA